IALGRRHMVNVQCRFTGLDVGVVLLDELECTGCPSARKLKGRRYEASMANATMPHASACSNATPPNCTNYRSESRRMVEPNFLRNGDAVIGVEGNACATSLRRRACNSPSSLKLSAGSNG